MRDAARNRQAFAPLALIVSSLVSAPAAADTDAALRAVMIPTGYADGEYLAMVQVAVEGLPLANATWDLDVSVSSEGRAPQRHAGRIRAERPETPVVYEALVELPPRGFRADLRARESSAGRSHSLTLEGRWPDPREQAATISPIVLLQPAQGAFLRDGGARSQGALALGQQTTVGIHLPTAVVSVVCRGDGTPGTLEVERRLEGSSSVEFETIALTPGEEPCAQVRDLIRPDTLGGGQFVYRVTVRAAGREVALKTLEFTAGRGESSR